MKQKNSQDIERRKENQMIPLKYPILMVHGMGDKIASVTTINTPHHGSITVDRLLVVPDVEFLIVIR